MPAARIVLYSATAASFALLLRALLIEPPPLWVAGVIMVGYLLLVALGLAVPQLEMFGDAVVSGRSGTGRVALTFDDGPDPVTTRAILEVLAHKGDRATFFVVGERVLRHPEVVREIVAAGHTLGVHGHRHRWTHAMQSPRAIAADIERARDAVERVTGVRPRYFRPPIGIVSPRTAVGAARVEAPIVLFSVRAGDGLIRRADTVVRRVVRGMRDGSIVLLHDASERAGRAPASLEALPRILEHVRRLGLTAVGVEAFVEADPVLPCAPGSVGREHA